MSFIIVESLLMPSGQFYTKFCQKVANFFSGLGTTPHTLDSAIGWTVGIVHAAVLLLTFHVRNSTWVVLGRLIVRHSGKKAAIRIFAKHKTAFL